MHPSRQHILYRYGTAAALIACAALFIMFYGFEGMFPPTPREAREQDLAFNLPLPEEMDVLRSALSILENLDTHAASFRAAVPDPGLVESSAMQAASPDMPGAEVPDLSLIFLSPRGNAAIIDNEVYEQGSVLPDGRRVERISMQGVVLELEGDRTLLPWTDPGQISITSTLNQPSVSTAPTSPAQNAGQDPTIPQIPQIPDVPGIPGMEQSEQTP